MASASSSSTTNAGPSSSSSSSSSTEPNILLLGLRRSGKTSLLQVLDRHLPPSDTLYLESTLKPSSVRLNIWDTCHVWDGLPSAITAPQKDTGLVTPGLRLQWSQVSAVIWVIDAQDDDYLQSLSSLHSVMLIAYASNPSIRFHVFLHKMDGLSEDYRDDTQAEIEKRIEDDLSDASSNFAFAQGVTPQRKDLHAMDDKDDDGLSSTIDWDRLEEEEANRTNASRGSSADGGDETPTEDGKTSASDQTMKQSRRPPRSTAKTSSTTSGLAANLERDISLSIHQTSIFDSSIFVAFSRVLHEIVLSSPMKQALSRAIDGLANQSDFEKLYLLHLPTRTYLISDSSPFDKNTFEVVCDYLGFLVGISGLFANLQSTTTDGQGETSESKDKEASSSTAGFASSASVLRLDKDILIAFWQIDESLALIGITRGSTYDKAAGLYEWNVKTFRKGVGRLKALNNGTA